MKAFDHDFDSLTEEAQEIALQSAELQAWIDMEMDEVCTWIQWTVDDFNAQAPVSLDYDGIGKCTTCNVDFYRVIEEPYPIARSVFSCQQSIVNTETVFTAYNALIDTDCLLSLRDEIEETEEKSENVPMGERDYYIYDVMELQAEYCEAFERAAAAAAQEVEELYRFARDLYDDRWERSEFARQFQWTEAGEYIGAW